MNTKPDDTTLALWLDDELRGEEFARVEAWAADHPGQFAAREEIRRWRQMISSTVPASEEPPAPEFFNERILHTIRDQSHQAIITMASAPGWGRWWMPMAACAGMAFAFWLGMHAREKDGSGMVGTSIRAASPAHVYAPEQGVEAEYFTSSHAAASVIVLNGVDAIPDNIDFNETATSRNWREIDSTAVIEAPSEPDL